MGKLDLGSKLVIMALKMPSDHYKVLPDHSGFWLACKDSILRTSLSMFSIYNV